MVKTDGIHMPQNFNILTMMICYQTYAGDF